MNDIKIILKCAHCKKYVEVEFSYREYEERKAPTLSEILEEHDVYADLPIGGWTCLSDKKGGFMRMRFVCGECMDLWVGWKEKEEERWERMMEEFLDGPNPNPSSGEGEEGNKKS